MHNLHNLPTSPKASIWAEIKKDRIFALYALLAFVLGLVAFMYNYNFIGLLLFAMPIGISVVVFIVRFINFFKQVRLNQRKEVSCFYKLSKNKIKFTYCLIFIGLVLCLYTIKITVPLFINKYHFSKSTDLLEVKDRLTNYYIYQTHNSRGYSFTTILVLRNGSRYWTNAVNKDSASNILKGREVEVEFYVDPHSSLTQIDGASKSYGLWVNGQPIMSLDTALRSEKANVYFMLTIVIASAICLAACSIFLIKIGWFLKKPVTCE